MSNPLVTAVIPSFNYGHYVIDAVKSALVQTYRPMEVIVVDDGSTDDTRKRLEPWMDSIRYVFQENRGLSAARNTGIRFARGEWIALLDADDQWHPHKTELQLRATEQYPDVGLIGSSPATSSTAALPCNPVVRMLGVRDFLISNPMGPSSALIKRDCFDCVGLFDETLRSVEDRDMWLRIATRWRCLHVDSPCWWYRHHAEQMSNNAQRMHDNYLRVLDKFFVDNPQYQAFYSIAYACFCADASWSFYRSGHRLRAQRLILNSLLHSPRTIPGSSLTKQWSREKLLVRYLLGDTLCRIFRPELI